MLHDHLRLLLIIFRVVVEYLFLSLLLLACVVATLLLRLLGPLGATARLRVVVSVHVLQGRCRLASLIVVASIVLLFLVVVALFLLVVFNVLLAVLVLDLGRLVLTVLIVCALTRLLLDYFEDFLSR